MPALGKKALLQIAPGVSPPTDLTNLESIYYTNSDKIRFQHGKLRKLKGWTRLFSSNNQRLSGAIRMLYNYTPLDGIERTLIGGSCHLYVYQQGAFYNITPLDTTSTPIPDSLSTVYFTDPGYSVTTEAGSSIVTFNIPNYLTPGDSVTISGVTGTIGGIAAASFNNTFTVTGSLDSNSFQVMINTPALSDDTGGGSGITFATAQIVVTLTDHGLVKGYRIKIEGASDVDGILAAAINKENIIEDIISDNVFIINVGTIATSYVSGGGGAATELYSQIACGNVDFSYGYGYGGGLYGLGLYGVGKLFTDGFRPPRIWSCDTFGDNIVLTPGNQSHVYLWENDIDVAPTILTNAPDAVNWVFESHGMVCVLGADNNPNVMQSSNVGNVTEWAPSASSTATIVTVPGARTFISQANARDVDLLFTTSRVYQMRYDNLPFIWNITELLTTDGLIGPKARVNVEDAVFWMGNDEFFVFDGTTVNILPDNTCKRYVFDNINEAQSYKTFASVSSSFNEIWWVYPSGSSNEPNAYVIYNYKEIHWSVGTIERTGAIEPANATTDVLMVQSRIVTTETLENNPLTNHFYTLGSNPIATTNGSPSIVITIPNHRLALGNSVAISGATTTNGILAANINGNRTVTNTSVNTITVTAGSNATSTGSGGGSSITVGTQVVTITVNHQFANDDSVSLANASGFGGFSVGDLSGTFVVQNFTATSIDIIVTTAYSTSQATGGGSFVSLTYPRTGRLFLHEEGFNDYDDACNINDPSSCQKPLYSFAETNYAQLNDGNLNALIYSVIPDSTQVGNISLTVKTKPYPQSSIENVRGPFTITEQIDKIDVMALGRQRKYLIESNELDQDFILGKWYEQATETTPI